MLDELIEILLPLVKKDDVKAQSIFNTDYARSNFAAKHDDKWKADKAGVYLNAKIIKPFCNIIINLMTSFFYEFRNYMQENEDEFEGRLGFEGTEKLSKISKCVTDIKGSKLYDAIIFKLSSNLHYKALIKDIVDENVNDIDDDNKIKITKPKKVKKND